jgi:predicted SnoaL-like aldol condensation-catalyzing enzyme
MMRTWTLLAAAGLLNLAACGSVSDAPGSLGATASAAAAPPVAVVGHPDPLSLLQGNDPDLTANKRLAFDLWRGVVNAGHVELADDLLTEDYIQHSPLLPTGRAAFKNIFSVVPRRDQIPALIEPPLVALIAEGDLVVMAFVENLPEPDGSGTYTSTHFNLFRVENGRLAEHWHSLQGPPGPDVLAPEAGGPQPVTGVTGEGQLALLQAATPELAGNKRLVFDLWRQAIDAGREEVADQLIAETYIEHNPNHASGREGFKSIVAARPDLPTETSIRAPLVAFVAEGDLVVVATMREHPHPTRAGATYTSTLFDMFRIEDGRIAEHWDADVLAAGAVATDQRGR